MYDNDGWCVALYIRDDVHRKIQERVLHYYQFRENRVYLNAWSVDQSSYWWRKYKDKGQAKVVLHKILRHYSEVRAGFIFRSDDFQNEDCFAWKSSVEGKIYLETSRENYKKILSEQFGIKWRGNPYLSLPFDSMKEE